MYFQELTRPNSLGRSRGAKYKRSADGWKGTRWGLFVSVGVGRAIAKKHFLLVGRTAMSFTSIKGVPASTLTSRSSKVRSVLSRVKVVRISPTT